MGTLITTLRTLDPELVVQFWLYMLIAFLSGALIGFGVTKLFYERDTERYKQLFNDTERIQKQLDLAQEEIQQLCQENQKLHQQLMSTQAFPVPQGDNDVVPAVKELERLFSS